MKNVILSADNELKVYLVPDFVAESLEKLCIDFSMNWRERLIHPHNWFDEADFVEYLNEKICKDEKCAFALNLGWDYDGKILPEKYRKCPRFNF